MRMSNIYHSRPRLMAAAAAVNRCDVAPEPPQRVHGRLALLAAPLIFALSGQALAMSVDPLRLYGDEIKFDVLRDGDKVDVHSVRFARNQDALFVHAQSDISVRVLGFTVYSFNYVSRSLYRGSRLIKLKAEINDDGAGHLVQLGPNGAGLAVRGPAGRFVAPGKVMPTNLWNAAVLGADRVLNTVAGELNSVEIVEMGGAIVETADGSRPARHFKYTGELEADVWYDDRGRWVRLRFQAKDGSTIDYLCRQCGGFD